MSHQHTHLRHIDQRDFVKSFNALCAGSHSRWEVWSDFIQFAAIAISNAVDLSNREDREKTYLHLASKYNKNEMQGFDCSSRCHEEPVYPSAKGEDRSG